MERVRVRLMNWYLAKLVFSINIQGQKGAEFDEQLRLVEAESMPAALLKAKRVGAESQEIINHQNGTAINWSFLAVTELIPFQNPQHGMELYSHIHERIDASSYTQIALRQADILEARFSFQPASV